MLGRLTANWVYGGTMAGVLILVLAPLLLPALGPAGQICYLVLAAYMLHQYEEHDGDRFRRFVNDTVAKGRHGLGLGDVFVINVPGVWGVIALSMWLAERVAPGWALIAVWLIVVNGVTHVVPAVAMRRANPGVFTALALFLPLGLWALVSLWPMASATQNALSLTIAVAIHIAIMVRALGPA